MSFFPTDQPQTIRAKREARRKFIVFQTGEKIIQRLTDHWSILKYNPLHHLIRIGTFRYGNSLGRASIYLKQKKNDYLPHFIVLVTFYRLGN